MVFTCASRRNLHRSPALPRDFSVPPAYHDDGEYGEFMNLKRLPLSTSNEGLSLI
ncbi:hypothetical protein COLSTE_02025 [Collinsella stercoris DSM 13279]|uniref:Uncharacterized protein n=1 Tax=Collinsella stercoris DSM 13279 TaxID=445975 RepID=B6GD48_9ACTN|nr:hypothetical protein COLSTE_02025 [Collinsella stercoris DSM 13279]